MRLRTLLLTTGAVLTAGAIALAPAVQAANVGEPIAWTNVGGNSGISPTPPWSSPA